MLSVQVFFLNYLVGRNVCGYKPFRIFRIFAKFDKISTRKTLLFQRFAKINTRKFFVEKANFNAVFHSFPYFYTISFNLRPCQEEKSACAINRTCDLICMCDGLSLALFARAIYRFYGGPSVSRKLQKPTAFPNSYRKSWGKQKGILSIHTFSLEI